MTKSSLMSLLFLLFLFILILILILFIHKVILYWSNTKKLPVDHIRLSIFDSNEFEALEEFDLTDIDRGLIQNNVKTKVVKK